MRKKVVIIDDAPNIRQIIAHVARDLGYESFEAKNGPEGVQKAIAKRPDLVVMDVSHADISGVGAARMLKEDPRTAKIPIIAHSVWASKNLSDEVLAAGIEEYLPGPLTIPALKRSIEKFANPT